MLEFRHPAFKADPMAVRLWDVRHLAKATQAHAQPPQKQQATIIEKHAYRLNWTKRWSSLGNRFFVHTRVPHDGHRERTKYPTRDQIKIKTFWDFQVTSSLSDHLTRTFLASPFGYTARPVESFCCKERTPYNWPNSYR